MIDQAARKAIREDLDTSFLVEAAAGTGKTTELVRRIVELLGSGRTTVDRVVAVTFTRKAAGELKLRLRQELDIARASAAEERRPHLEHALAHLEEARIGTIHAFCAELLRERPVEARVDPCFVELAEDEAPRLYRRAFRRWFQEQLADLPAGLERALARLAMSSWDRRSPTERIADAGWRLIEWRDFAEEWSRSEDNPAEGLAELAAEVSELGQLAARCTNPRDYLFQALESACAFKKWYEGQEADAHSTPELESRIIQVGSALKRNKRKGRGRYAEGLSREDLLSRRLRTIERIERYQMAADADLAALLWHEFRPLVRRYEALKEKQGGLDFVDLLIRARDLIRRDTNTRRHCQERFTHIFVDEFQDTDPIQIEILLLLSASEDEVDTWQDVRPVPGKLFIVGDPKQSIYRFRRADIITYQRVKTLLFERGVRVVNLSHSFRATAQIQDIINRAFSPEITASERAGQPDYVALTGGPAEPEAQPSVIALPVPHPHGRYRITQWAVEESFPEAAAAFVDWLLTKSGWTVRDPDDPSSRVAVAPHHICLLFRRYLSFGRDITTPYVAGLEARRVPHVLVGARSYHQREEVEVLRAALTAVEWPDDELAVFACLRGPLFALADRELLSFKTKHKHLHPFRGDEGSSERVSAALAFLRGLHEQRNQRPIVATVLALLSHTRAHAGFALRPGGAQVLANVQRVAELARTFEITGGVSFRGFVERLIEESEKEQSADAPVVEEGAEGVRIMTVHAAKGLEFPVVILADPTASLSRDGYVDRYIDADRGLAAVRILGCAPRELIDHRELESDRDRAEGVRLSYVAATRARDLLVAPTVGEGPAQLFGGTSRESWLRPLEAVLYPKAGQWGAVSPAPGCPPFGTRSTLSAPHDAPERTAPSIHPGLHHTASAESEVVWWDPALLDLSPPPSFGLEKEELLAPAAPASDESVAEHAAWESGRIDALDTGAVQSISPFSPSEAIEDPGGAYMQGIALLSLPRSEGRPRGARFGSLVHMLLRDVPFDASESLLRAYAETHGRTIGAPEAEREAAAHTVAQFLGHPFGERLRTADQILREVPLYLDTEDGLLAGEADLVVREGENYLVVDYKTDADLAPKLGEYEMQLGWYRRALEAVTGVRPGGMLLQL